MNPSNRSVYPLVRRLAAGLLLAGVLLWAGPPGIAVPRGKEPMAKALAPEESLRKARVNGKYEMLLQQIKVEGDFQKYANFRDLGARTEKEYAGFKDLPAGHWVYVYPYWYIWRDLTKVQAQKIKRQWGPEQATGKPDTWPNQGDIVTAWASQTPDGQREWLLLEYARPVVAKEVHIYETFNPGAVDRVTAFDLTGKEIEVWKGKDPTAAGAGGGISKIACKKKVKTNRIKIYINSPAVLGWNEIDAVGLIDQNGKTQWATAADASSTFAQGQ
jgi:hypothetical protein